MGSYYSPDPSPPGNVSGEVTIAVPSPIAVAGRFAHLVGVCRWAQAIDISNPDAPLLVGEDRCPVRR